MTQSTPDAEARIAELYQLYEPQIRRYAARRAGEWDAADVVAETFLTAWRRADDIPPDPHVLPWLYAVARRVLANQRRGNQRRTQLHDKLLDQHVPDDANTCRLEVADRFQQVTTAIEDLSDSDAELIRLTAWDGLTPGEIASTMGIEPNAARQRLHRARRRLALAVAAVAALSVALGALYAAGLLGAAAVVETEFTDDGLVGEPEPRDQEAEADDNAKTIVDATADETQPRPIHDEVPGTAAVVEARPAPPITSAPEETLAPTTTPSLATEPSVAPTTSAPVNAAPTTEAPTTSVTLTRSDGPFAIDRDLLSVHLDFSHTDDAHSAVASAEVSKSFEITPWIVAGTQSPASSSFVHEYTSVMRATYDTAWQDTTGRWEAAVSETADEWLRVIDGGGRVWVAEGGVSDFTAAVLDAIERERPGLDTVPLIQVVQHAQRNEDASLPNALSSVQTRTTYLRIDDGNNLNETADLFADSPGFEAAAVTGPLANGWTAAFAVRPAGELDFSDTVAVLHILDVGLVEVSDPDDFISRFLS